MPLDPNPVAALGQLDQRVGTLERKPSGGSGGTGASGSSYAATHYMYSSGTWTKPDGLLYATFEAIGGGGSGGGASAAIATGHSSGAGGGAGGYAIASWMAASLGSTESFTVGLGGAPTLGAGINGGDSGIKGMTAGGGGGGGTHATTNVYGAQGGGGGSATLTGTGGCISSFAYAGEAGEEAWGNAAFSFSGNGGSTKYGSGGRGWASTAGAASNPGVQGDGFGSGGGGAQVTGGGVTAYGGWGCQGVVIITEYFAIAGSGGSGLPIGPAGGDLAGNYPNPTIAVGAVTSAKIADGTIVAADIAAGVIPIVPTSMPPSGAAGGSLAGNYPNPTIGAGKVTTTEIADGTIVDADVATANKDGLATAPSLRTLGTGVQQAASGAHTHAGLAFYPDPTDNSDIATYKLLRTQPSTAVESNVLVACTGTGDVLVGAFATDPGTPGAVDFPAGTTLRNIYANVSAGTARLHLQVYKRSAAGVETLIRDEFSNNFTDTVVTLQQWSAVATSAGSLLSTDRLVMKLYAQRVAGSTSINVTTYFEGTAHTSNIVTTIAAGSPIGGAGGALTGTYPNPTLAADSVGSAQIVDGAVTNAELAGPSVSTSKIYDNAIITQHIFDGAVTSAKIADGTIVVADLSAAAVSALKPDAWQGGSSVLADLSVLNFTGAGVAVSTPSAGQVDVSIPGLSAGANLPYATAAGLLNTAALGINGGVSGAVTFPVGRFTQIPVVAVSHISNGYTFAASTTPSTSGVTLKAYNPSATATTGTGQIQWIAVQMTSTSGPG